MAKVQNSSVAFDIRHLNLHDIFQGTTTNALFANGPLKSLTESFYYGGQNFTVPSQDLHVSSRVDMTNSANLSVSLMGNSFGFDSQGFVDQGTISILWGPGAYLLGGVSIMGLTMDVQDFLAAARTRGNADDYRLMMAHFAGDDMFEGSFYGDNFAGGSGKDYINSAEGDDRVLGGADDDFIMTGFGNDTAYGGAGNDIFINRWGSDRVYGGLGSDTLQASDDADTLTGGAGADRFVFENVMGQSTITDFADGKDKVVLAYVVNAFSDLTIVQDGRDTVISYGMGSITLKRVDHTTITAKDFILTDDHFMTDGQVEFFTGWNFLG